MGSYEKAFSFTLGFIVALAVAFVIVAFGVWGINDFFVYLSNSSYHE